MSILVLFHFINIVKVAMLSNQEEIWWIVVSELVFEMMLNCADPFGKHLDDARLRLLVCGELDAKAVIIKLVGDTVERLGTGIPSWQQTWNDRTWIALDMKSE